MNNYSVSPYEATLLSLFYGNDIFLQSVLLHLLYLHQQDRNQMKNVLDCLAGSNVTFIKWPRQTEFVF